MILTTACAENRHPNCGGIARRGLLGVETCECACHHAGGIGVEIKRIEVAGRIPVPGDGPLDGSGTCLWCQRPTGDVAMAPGLGREVPLHMECAGQMIVAYKAHLRGRSMARYLTERATRVWGPPQLGDGR